MDRRNFLMTAVIPSLSPFASDTQSGNVGFVVRAGKARRGEPIVVYGINPIDFKITSEDTDGSFSMCEYTSVAKGGPPLHVNLNQDEIYYLMEGAYLFKIGDEMHDLNAGDTIFCPKGVPHTFSQKSDRGRVLLMHLPPGKIESYFKALGKLRQPPSPEEGAKLFANHDMQIVGPPIE